MNPSYKFSFDILFSSGRAMNPFLCFPVLIGILILSVSPCLKGDDAIALPGCQSTCGNVKIPFPFGIASNCYLDSWYEIECKTIPPSNSSTKPFLSKLDVEVLEIVLDAYLGTPIQTITVSIPPLKVCTNDTTRQRLSSIDLRGSPYNFSTYGHAFLMEGCAGTAALVNETEETMAGCSTVCRNNNNTAISINECYGVECCQMQLRSTESSTWPSVAYSSPLKFYHIDFYGQSLGGRRDCVVASLIKNDSLTSTAESDRSTVPVALVWSWVSSGWPDYDPDKARCNHDQTINTTLCVCNTRLFGNPYIYDGCEVVEVCRRCRGYCDQVSNSYVCLPNGVSVISSILVWVSIAIGPLLLVFACRWLHGFNKRRSKTERRVKIFKLKLEQHQSTSEGVVERTKLFTYKQLDKATNHFNENRVLGKGGQGIVYKGMLDDGRTVAIKKLKMMDESQMEQLINEVVILSQINHRNVVKLMGCCLEKEVPLLVYEFISNGTLAQHIHDPDEDFVLSWSMRLKIAAGTAGAISYLHSYSSIPVYHRDIKSSNILLDDKYKAKVSDFGSSKTTSLDQTHLTTLVRGTWGYLDPEYFRSNQFTDKSDVYSFGVVLLELLSGKKPIYRDDSMEQKSLVTEFLAMVRNSRLLDIVNHQVVNEAKVEELVSVANLAKRCLNGSGRFRPTMKEVAMILEMIIKSPNEIPIQDQQSFLDEEFESVMAELSDVESMPNPLSTRVGDSYIDVQPLLRDTM